MFVFLSSGIPLDWPIFLFFSFFFQPSFGNQTTAHAAHQNASPVSLSCVRFRRRPGKLEPSANKRIGLDPSLRPLVGVCEDFFKTGE